jgi:hypothetical protein
MLAYSYNILVDTSVLLFKPIYIFVNHIQISGQHMLYSKLLILLNNFRAIDV